MPTDSEGLNVVTFDNSSAGDGRTFAERVDVEVITDGYRMPEPAEISTKPAGHQNEEIAALRAEVLTLRQRVRELEAFD